MADYSTRVTVLNTRATGLYTVVKGKSVLTRGNVTLNVVNERLNSITVTSPTTRKRVLRVEGAQVRTVALSFGSKQDNLMLKALTS